MPSYPRMDLIHLRPFKDFPVKDFPESIKSIVEFDPSFRNKNPYPQLQACILSPKFSISDI
jgi:hypothetical protein